MALSTRRELQKHVQKRTTFNTTRTLHSRYHTLLSLVALAMHVMWYTHYFVYRRQFWSGPGGEREANHNRPSSASLLQTTMVRRARERTDTHTTASDLPHSGSVVHRRAHIKNQRSVCRRSV